LEGSRERGRRSKEGEFFSFFKRAGGKKRTKRGKGEGGEKPRALLIALLGEKKRGKKNQKGKKGRGGEGEGNHSVCFTTWTREEKSNGGEGGREEGGGKKGKRKEVPLS